MKELKNCPNCGNLFVKHLRVLCDTCYKKEEAMFEKVASYIRKKENRQATLHEVQESTGVPEAKITSFIRQGRIQVAHLPHFYYECEMCEQLINEGRLCQSCKMEIRTELETRPMEKNHEKLGKSYHLK
ncbi:flagellar operon protein TIGR03826 [Fictibacillus solisalsi]|uniref:Flagellar operon protein TIGR03826 n=1 Tax=Fictibacillus solisalsi TaxID=459525 RepID=A0A1G9XZI5_9BACL|nr:TIGR03826 family flagellar region protein [Fictibacillus solisalsi]SDN02272.1 flagellar operon protein TIGR03826 [Fictibacillus solisalsi]